MRLTPIAFQACSFNHSDISPFRINKLRRRVGCEIADVISPPMFRDHLAHLQYSVDASVKVRGSRGAIDMTFIRAGRHGTEALRRSLGRQVGLARLLHGRNRQNEHHRERPRTRLVDVPPSINYVARFRQARRDVVE